MTPKERAHEALIMLRDRALDSAREGANSKDMVPMVLYLANLIQDGLEHEQGT